MPDVVRRMTIFLRPYRSPVYEDCDGYGAGWGSGSFIRVCGKVFILTNEHVSRVRRNGKVLAYQFDGQDIIRAAVGNHFEISDPTDLGLLPVDMASWNEKDHSSKAIEIDQIASSHEPARGELLAFTGFAGDKVSFHFNTLCAEGTCYVAREITLPVHEDVDPSMHFGMDYRPDLATNVIGTGGLPRPPGLSGSTVWNTGFVEARMNGLEWSPEMARVTGVVWGWPSGDGCLVATRAEHIRSFIQEATGSSAPQD